MHGREGFTLVENKKMTLSQDTLEGLCMSGTHAHIFIVTLFIFHYFILRTVFICGDGSIPPFPEDWALSSF